MRNKVIQFKSQSKAKLAAAVFLAQRSCACHMYFYYEVYVSSVKQRKIGKIRFNLLHPDLGSTSEWLVNEGNLLQSIRSTTPIWVVTCHQYGISWLVLRRSFCGNPMVATQNVSCFLRLAFLKIIETLMIRGSCYQLKLDRNCIRN